MDGNEPPPGPRFIQVQPSTVNKVEGIMPSTTGQNDNAINQQLILNANKTNVKFFPFKPAKKSNDRKAQIEHSFREVEITFSNHVQDAFLSREAKANNSAAALSEVKEEIDESKQEKGKKQKDRKKKTRVMPAGNTKEKHDEDGHVDSKVGSESELKAGTTDGKEKKKTIKTKQNLEVDGKAGSESNVNGGTDGKGKRKATETKQNHEVDGKAGSESKVNGGTDGKGKRKATKTKKKRGVDDMEDGKAGSDFKVNDGTDGKRNKKETKTKEKNKSNKSKTKGKEESTKKELTEAEEKKEAAATGNVNNRRKLPCVFGFISTWLAKRKEKRRDKKRKAIAARASPPPRLVEYEHKTTRGGEAFTIEVDNRPSFAKPLLPPIKQTPGPIRRDRYQNTVCRRAEILAQTKEAAREYERKRVKYKDKRAESDHQFRQKANVSLRQKQANAEWNRNTISRCKSRLQTPFTMSPRLRAPSAISPSEHSDNNFNEPSAESSFGSIRGPSCFSEGEDDHGVWIVDKVVDIPIF